MPLRDHFHEPGRSQIGWESLHSCWLHCIMMQLNVQTLPVRYRAEPEVHFGFQVQTDVANFEQDEPTPGTEAEQGNGVATAVWAPPRTTIEADIDFRALDLFEIRVVDASRGRRLVAVVELVSPANKDRPAHREAFAVKCASFLQRGVSVVVVDVVSEREANLHNELAHLLHLENGVPLLPEGSLYSAAYRTTKPNEDWKLAVWLEELTVGASLPTMPLWLAENLAVPLHLEASYEEARRLLRLG